MPFAFSEARAWGRVLLDDYVKQGFNKSRAYKELRKVGASYRYQDMLRDFDEFAGYYRNESRLARLAHDTKVPTHYMTETSFTRPRKYRVRGFIESFDNQSNEVVKQNVQWYTDEANTIPDMINEFLDAYGTNYDIQGRAIQTVGVRQVLHNDELGY